MLMYGMDDFADNSSFEDGSEEDGSEAKPAGNYIDDLIAHSH